MSTMVQGGRYLSDEKAWLGVMSLEVLGQLQECRAGGREFQIVGDATKKL